MNTQWLSIGGNLFASAFMFIPQIATGQGADAESRARSAFEKALGDSREDQFVGPAILQAMAPDSIPFLVKAARSEDDRSRRKALEILRSLTEKRGPVFDWAVRDVLEDLNHPDMHRRRFAVTTSAALIDPSRMEREFIAKLKVALRDSDLKVRQSAVTVLSGTGPPDIIVDDFIDILANDRDPDFRRTVALTLERMGSRFLTGPSAPQVNPALSRYRPAWEVKAVASLTAALEDPSPEVRAAAAGALEPFQQSDGTITALVKALADEDADVHHRASTSIAGIPTSLVAPHLLHALEHENVRVRQAAIVDLGRRLMGPSYDYDARLPDEERRRRAERIEAIIPLLADGDADIRELAAGCLAGSGRQAIDPLVKALRDDRELVRSGAAEALVVYGVLWGDLDPILAELDGADRELRASLIDVLVRIAKESADQETKLRDLQPADAGIQKAVQEILRRLE